jgi:inorganic phosphate transporter, PiT family
MSTTLLFAVTIIFVALVFDYVNGFHDAANSIATVVATRVLSPAQAVVWAAFFNFIAFAFFGTRVAKTIGGDLIQMDRVEEQSQLFVLLCALIGAIVWDLITWYYGLPSSSSHALVGGLGGAAIAATSGAAGLFKLIGWIKTVTFIFISPLLGLVLGYCFMEIIGRLFRKDRPAHVDRLFRKLQLVSAALYSLGHGGNDAQKTMGIIAGILVAANLNASATTEIPLWVVLSCHGAIAAGTLSGGWRIVHTMGSRITRLQPVGGFAAETAGAATIFMATYGGIPVSTTHTITGAIVGVGTNRRWTAVRWGVAMSIVWAWIFTIPASALIAALSFYLFQVIRQL